MPIPQLKSTRDHYESGSSFTSRPLGQSRKSRFSRPPLFFAPKPKGSKAKKRHLLRRLFPYFLYLCLLGGIFLIGLIAYYSKDLPDPYKIMDRSVPLSTKIYDSKGETLLYEVHGAEQRTLVTVSELPKYIIQSTIAVEDKEFYNHSGISIRGIIRGIFKQLLKGERVQGGSTLTQQFVKNAILTDERRVSRKIKEWVLSYRIEKKFSKDEILQLYFNEIPYGSSAYGVESAAHYYFDKDAKNLTLAEAAILAALPQAPTYYSPYGNHKDALIARQHVVLNLMAEQDYITKEEAETAKQAPLAFKKRAENINAPHFVMYVKELLEQEYGALNVEQGGWKIITSLDWELQQAAEKAIAEQAPKNKEKYEAGNAALVAIDVASGQIKAMVGSKDYFDDEIDGQVNVALAPRQPGSSLKPFVYLTAFTKGFRPDTMLFDLKTKFGIKADGTPYEPQNYDGKEHGPVTMRQALAGSLNIPAVKTLYLAGLDSVLKTTADFGYTTLKDKDRYGLSLVLGGGEVKLLEHTNAYAALAREGVYQDYVAILKVEDPKGKVIKENQDIKGRRVMDKKYVHLLTDIMSDNSARAYIFGVNNFLTLGDRPVAAKTGTTNDYHDAWTMGFTPDLAVGVWVGNSDNKAMSKGADGSVIAAPIWNKFMREATAKMPISDFKKETLEPCDKPMVCGTLGKEIIVKINKQNGKLASEYTPYTLIEERKYNEVHNILYYVNTNDPLGAPLENPGSDPQYSSWEAPVKLWAEKEGYTNSLPPTEVDDSFMPSNQPTVSWLSPSANQALNQVPINLSVQASALQGLSRVEYFIDQQKIGASFSSPYSLAWTPNSFVANGQHVLRALAFDNNENFKEAIINIDLQIAGNNRSYDLKFVEPSNQAVIGVSQLPTSIKLSLDKPSAVKKIDFYYQLAGGSSQWFNYLENPSDTNLSIPWGQGLASGNYQLYMIVLDSVGQTATSPLLNITIE